MTNSLEALMPLNRIIEIANGASPLMGEKESLGKTAMHYAAELEIATSAFQAAGLAQIAAEEALEQAQQEVEKLEAECDRNYISGMKTGWNYCDAGNSDGFNKCLELRRKGVFEATAVKPVKLPPLVNESNLPFAAMGWNAYRTYVVKVLHAAGIQVEGE